MTDPLKPRRGGFVRPFGAASFIVEFLKGNGPEGTTRIDPAVGAPMADVFAEYKSALHRAQVRATVEKEEEKRIRRGETAFSEAEYNARIEHYSKTLPFKQLKMRYSSFCRYFGHLKRLGWVEPTGRTEASVIQSSFPNAPPRVYYRLTEAGKTASKAAIADPLKTLYGYTREQRSAKKAPTML